MPEQLTDTDSTGLTPALLLDEVRRARAIADAADRQVLRLAAVWAEAHPDLDDAGNVRWWKAPKSKPVDEMLEDALTDGAPRSPADGQPTSPDEMDEAYEWHGIPGIAWNASAPFGAANNTTTGGGKAQIRDALILKHRLPLTWKATMAGAAPAWRARKVAQAVIGAPADVAAFVDAEVAGRIGTLGPTALARKLQEAMLTLHAELVEIESIEALDACHVTLRPETLNDSGVVDLDVRGQWADLVEFDRAVARIAAALKESDHPHAKDGLGVRRAAAQGVMADPYLHAALLEAAETTDDEHDVPVEDRLPGTSPVEPVDYEPPTDEPHDDDPVDPLDDDRDDERDDEYAPAYDVERRTTPAPTGSTRSRRGRAASGKQTMLYFHLTDAALLGFDPLARDEQGRVHLADSLVRWLGRPGVQLTVRPVIDLNRAHTRNHDPGVGPTGQPDSGRVGPQLAEQVALHDRTCVHPWCSKPARRCDKDHVLSSQLGGPTCVCNLAPLCRQHHQLKTHAGWRYERLAPGLYLWRDPHGLHYLVTPDGTRPLGGSTPGRAPTPETAAPCG